MPGSFVSALRVRGGANVAETVIRERLAEKRACGGTLAEDVPNSSEGDQCTRARFAKRRAWLGLVLVSCCGGACARASLMA